MTTATGSVPSLPPASSAELSSEAEAFVKSVGAAADLPAFVRNVRSIGTVAGNLDARVGLLEQAIVQDVALAAKVLRIANSVATGGASNGANGVGSVRQAIMLLGYDRVQHLSTAASVFDHVEQDAPSVRDLLVESVLAANHSLQLSFAAGFDRPELAYLCGLFRRFGEVLVACYRPRPYGAWLQRVQAGGEYTDGAESAHFGFAFEEVGAALAKRWGMPPAVVRTMRTYRGVSLQGDMLHALTQCSAEVARGLYGAAPVAAIGNAGTRVAVESAGDAAVDAIRARFAPVFGIDVTAMRECMASALTDAKSTLITMQVDLDVWIAGHVEAVTNAVTNAVTTDEPYARPAPEASAHAAERLRPNADDSTQEARLRDIVRELVQHRHDAHASFSVGAVTDSTLRAACEAGYERGVLGISTEDFKLIRGRVGIGRGSTELARNFLLRPTPAFGPLGAALQQRSDLFVELTGANAKLYGRDRLLKDLSPSHFVLLPLVLEAKLLGCLYFDSTIESVHATETTRRLLCDLRDHLVAAFAHHRAGASDSTAGAA